MARNRSRHRVGLEGLLTNLRVDLVAYQTVRTLLVSNVCKCLLENVCNFFSLLTFLRLTSFCHFIAFIYYPDENLRYELSYFSAVWLKLHHSDTLF